MSRYNRDGNQFGDINAPVNLGSIGNNVAFGNNAVVIQGNISPELVAVLTRRVDAMASNLAEVAHAAKLQQNQIQLLAGDLARIRQAITAPEPDQTEFKSAAADLWSKLMMVGQSVDGVRGLGEGLKFIAGALGWSLGIGGL